MKEGLLLAAAGLLVVLTFLPLWKNPVWWVRGLDFPRLQLCVLAFALLLAQGVFLSYSNAVQILISVLSLVCLAYHAWWIIPYTRLWRCEVKSADTRADGPLLRVMAANVLTPNRHADKLIALVREHRPDVLVTLETDQWWEDQLAELSDEYPTPSAARWIISMACTSGRAWSWKIPKPASWSRTTFHPCTPTFG